MKINETVYSIPYSGCKILAVFEANSIPIKFDCRKGTCKSCVVRISFEGESVESLACMEEALDGMEIFTEGLQPDEIIARVPPMETRRVTTRKIVNTGKTQTEASKANAKVLRILSQAQEAALEGNWDGCAAYTEELLEILKLFDKPEDVQSVFMTGPSRDILRDFIASLSGSSYDRCFQLGKDFSKEINRKSLK